MPGEPKKHYEEAPSPCAEDGSPSHYNPGVWAYARQRLQVGESELAKMMGVFPATIQSWESGTAYPTCLHAARLYAIFRRKRIESIPLFIAESGVVSLDVIRMKRTPKAPAARTSRLDDIIKGPQTSFSLKYSR